MKNQLTLFDDYPDSGNLNENKENKPDENQRIEDLILGKVARRILSTNGIETTDQLISRPVTDYEAMAGNARKAYQEIMRLYQSVTEGKPLTFSETSVKHRKEDQALYEGLPDSLADVSTGVLLLGKRARKQLTDHGINTMGEACSLTVQQMKTWKGLGATTMNELVNQIELWASKQTSRILETESVCTEVRSFFQAAADMMRPVICRSWNDLYHFASSAELKMPPDEGEKKTGPEQFIEQLLYIPVLNREERSFWNEFLAQSILGQDELAVRLKEANESCEAELLIHHALSGGILQEFSGKILPVRLTVNQYLPGAALSSRNLQILQMRLEGKTLQEIGDETSLTRERVRQIIAKTLSDFPLLSEDFYAEPYKAFRMNSEEFREIFPSVSLEGYEYLSGRYRNGKTPCTLETIQSYHGSWKEQIQEGLRLIMEKNSRKMNITQMTRFVLQESGNSPMTPDEIIEEIRNLLNQGYSLRGQRMMSRFTVINDLRTAQDIVFNQAGQARIFNMDPDTVFEQIDFTPYMDTVISAYRIYRDNKELMKQLDLKDGHELYSLIKRSLPFWSGPFSLTSRRNPVLIVGDGDEARQALELLEELQQVSSDDFYREYSIRYGHREDTSRGNPALSEALAPYEDGQFLTIRIPEADQEEKRRFQAALSQEEVWKENDVLRMFETLCPQTAARTDLSSPLLYSVGWKKRQGYIYSRKYSSATDCFDSLFFHRECLEIDSIDPGLVQLPVFLSLVDQHRQNMELFEEQPGVYISRERLYNKYSICESEILSTLKEISSVIQKTYFNSYSLRSFLSKYVLFQKLEGNYFLADSILRLINQNRSISVKGARIMARKGTPLNLASIAQWLATQNGKQDLQGITDLFNQTFGSDVPASKIKAKILESGLSESILLP